MKRLNRKLLCLILAICMGISPAIVVAAQTPSVEMLKDNLSYVVPQAVAVGTAYPRRILTSPEMEMLPIEVFSAAGLKELGFDPLDVESVTAMVIPPSPMPSFGVVLRFTKPYSLDDFKPQFTQKATKSELDGKPCLMGVSPMAPSFFMPDNKTLLIAPAPALKAMLDNHKNPKPGTARKLMDTVDKSSDTAVVVDIQSLRPMMLGGLQQAPLPPQLNKLPRLIELVSSIKCQAKVVGDKKIATLELNTTDEASAKEATQIINQLIDTGIAMLEAQMAKDLARKNDPVAKAGMQYVQRISKKIATYFRPTQDGNTIKFSVQGADQQYVAVIGILVALLLPAVQAAREAARRMASTNNLKQIGLAMLNYVDARKHFPQRANFDKNGKPLLSWRVHILPYLEQQALYKKFHLDEPWDSPHNKKLIPLMPSVYRNPSSPFPITNGKADYLVPTGPGSIFEGKNKTRFRDIKDGISNTILAVEANPDRAVIWTKPDDLKYDKSDPLDGLGKAHPGIFSALFADGSVCCISADIDPKVLLYLFQMNDGQPVDCGNF